MHIKPIEKTKIFHSSKKCVHSERQALSYPCLFPYNVGTGKGYILKGYACTSIANLLPKGTPLGKAGRLKEGKDTHPHISVPIPVKRKGVKP